MFPTALACLLLAAACSGASATGGAPIRVGVVHSLTGPIAISEKPCNDGTLMAIEEINARGGLLGRRIEPIVVDTRSDMPAFATAAQRLITRDRVSAIFGGFTSASRKVMVPVVEKHRNLLLYPTFYEGIESSPNVIYTGATPNQLTIPAVKWFLENRGRRFFLVGSDYVYPRATNAIIKDQLSFLGGEVLGESYMPLGSTAVAAAVQEILRARPEVIVSTIVGDTNVPFFRELRRAGITPQKIPTLSLVVGESEMKSLNAAEMAQDYVAQSYFETIGGPRNADFVRRYRARFGRDRAVSDSMEAAYVSVHLWAQAVRQAGTTDAAAVVRAMRGQRFEAPEGTVYVDEENLHLWKVARVGQIRADGKIDVIWASEVIIHPVPYPVFRTKRAWRQMLHNLYTGWGNSWAAPPTAAAPPPARAPTPCEKALRKTPGRRKIALVTDSGVMICRR